MTPKVCPSCNACLEKEDIYTHFLGVYGNEAEALEAASYYGWTKDDPCCFSRCIGVYDIDSDLCLSWKCADCKHQWPRELKIRRRFKDQ